MTIALGKELSRKRSEGIKIEESERLLIAQLVESYRWKATGVGRILDAPLLPLLVGTKLKEIWTTQYDPEYDRNLREQLANFSTHEGVFDYLIDAYLDGTLPESLAGDFKDLSPCLAKKIKKGKSDTCTLDSSDEIEDVSVVTVGLHRGVCGTIFDGYSNCDTRTIVFDYAKPKLIAARDDGTIDRTVREAFDERFPAEFGKGFFKTLNMQLGIFPDVITGKFRGSAKADLWKAPIVEILEPIAQGGELIQYRFREFSLGLMADVLAASALAESQDEKLRGVASILLYAAANRVLMMTGGKHFAFEDGKFAEPSASNGTRDRLPDMTDSLYGGWGVEASGSYADWDWGTYRPLDEKGASPFRWIPAQWAVHEKSGKPAGEKGDKADLDQSLEDMALLVEAALEFLRTVSAEGVFEERFFPQGVEPTLEVLVDPRRPEIFPSDGKRLLVGLLGALLQNLIHPQYGHVERNKNMISFYEWIGRSGPLRGKPSRTKVIAHALRTAAELRDALRDERVELDPQIYKYENDINLALNFGTFNFLAPKGIEAEDGGVREIIDQAQTSGRRFEDAVMMLDTLSTVYAREPRVVYLLHIQSVLHYLDKLWGDSAVPPAFEGMDVEASTEALIQMIGVWRAYSPILRVSRLSQDPQILWEKWDLRMEVLEDAVYSRGKAAFQRNSD